MDTLYASILALEAQTQAHVHQLGAALLANAQPGPATGLPPPSADIWTLERSFTRLLDLYHDFIVAATTANARHLLSTYRIPRRLWIYGVVAFIEVLKNVLATNPTPSAANMDVGPSFIVHAFTTIGSLYEIDEPAAWADKLAELARIAIQLYPVNYLDWKLTASHWYHQTTLLGSHGHGKLYYHQCTVEYDNLLAFTLLSKSLLCKDPFVPTQSYLQSIIDNVCSQRSILSPLEMAMIDFVKIHKILLLQDYNTNSEMKAIVGHYSTNFGLDSSNLNFFDSHPEITNSILVSPPLAFWYSKSPYFAISNINHLLGLGNPCNLGAKVFGLVEMLKLRRDKKKVDDPTNPTLETLTASQLTLDQSLELLSHFNKGVLQLSMNMFKTYLTGPIISAAPHTIIWLWFLIALTKTKNSHPKSIFIKILYRTIPWDSLIGFINDSISMLTSRSELVNRLQSLVLGSSSNPHPLQSQNLNPVPMGASPANTALTEETTSIPSDHESLTDSTATTSASLLQRVASVICDESVESQLCYGTLWFDQITSTPPSLRGPTIDKSLLGELIPWNVHNEGERWIIVTILACILIDCNEWPLEFDETGQWVQYKTNNEEDHENKERVNKDVSDEDEILNNWFNDDRLVNLETFQTEGSNLKFHGEVIEALRFIKCRPPKWGSNSKRFMTDFVNGIFPASLVESVAPTQTSSNRVKIESNDNESDKKLIKESEGGDEETGYEGGEDSEDSEEDEDYYYEDEDEDLEDDEDEDELDELDALDDPSNKLVGDLGSNMDTILTFLSLDTNIWLKYPGRIYKCVKHGIFRLCVPLTVFQELRSLRRSQDMNIADSATRAVLIIRQLYQEVDLLPLRANGTKANSLNETLEFEQNQNWRVQSDDLIIQSVQYSNQFGRDYLLGQGYKIGKPPVWDQFEPPLQTGNIWSGAYMGLTIPPFAIRGQLLRSKCMDVKNSVLDKDIASVFWYNILVSDDKNMSIKAKNRGVKVYNSEWLWLSVERVASGRCYN